MLIWILPFFMFYAAICDAISYRIPNWISLALAGSFLLFAWQEDQELVVIGQSYLLGMIVLIIGFFAFCLRLIGAGDVKLFAAVSVWLGQDWQLIVYFSFAVLCLPPFGQRCYCFCAVTRFSTKFAVL